jgi:hypothetical protein
MIWTSLTGGFEFGKIFIDRSTSRSFTEMKSLLENRYAF